jgi:hypothetical protein
MHVDVRLARRLAGTTSTSSTGGAYARFFAGRQDLRHHRPYGRFFAGGQKEIGAASGSGRKARFVAGSDMQDADQRLQPTSLTIFTG